MKAKTTLSTTLMAVVSLAMLLMAVPRKASAYVDPGSGAMIWQLAAAALFGSLFRMRRISSWVRTRFAPHTARKTTVAGGRGSLE